MIHALLAALVLSQDPSAAPAPAPAAQPSPAAEPPAPAAPVTPPGDEPPPNPTLTPPPDKAAPDKATGDKPGADTDAPDGAPKKDGATQDEYEDIPPPFAAGPAAVGAGAATLGFVAGGLCCGVGCIPAALAVPFGLLVTPCLACSSWFGAGAFAAVGSSIGAVWEFVAGNKGPLVWARLAAPPAAGMAAMLPGVVLGALASAMGIGALLVLTPADIASIIAGGLFAAGAAFLVVGLVVGGAAALATYGGLVVYDAASLE